MKVSELIEKLNVLPSDLDVEMVYDGGARLGIDFVYESISGKILLVNYMDMPYAKNEWPKDQAIHEEMKKHDPLDVDGKDDE